MCLLLVRTQLCFARMDESNTFIVNGKFSANQLAEVLDLFIEKFVLCGSCRNPETIVTPSKVLFFLFACTISF